MTKILKIATNGEEFFNCKKYYFMQYDLKNTVIYLINKQLYKSDDFNYYQDKYKQAFAKYFNAQTDFITQICKKYNLNVSSIIN